MVEDFSSIPKPIQNQRFSDIIKKMDLENNETNDCIFCKIIKNEIPAEKIYDDDNFIGILDNNPKTKGHSLVISKKHFKTILDMPSTLGSEFLDAVKAVALKQMNENDCPGFNLIVNTNKVAGQIVDHFHAHIIPRKKDDGFKM